MPYSATWSKMLGCKTPAYVAITLEARENFRLKNCSFLALSGCKRFWNIADTHLQLCWPKQIRFEFRMAFIILYGVLRFLRPLSFCITFWVSYGLLFRMTFWISYGLLFRMMFWVSYGLYHFVWPFEFRMAFPISYDDVLNFIWPLSFRKAFWVSYGLHKNFQNAVDPTDC